MPIDKHQAADKVIEKKFNLKRSSKWPEVEREFRETHPRCAACGATDQLNVHHMFPFHFVVICGRPDLELDPRNLITLCTKHTHQHHLLLGHLDDYESYNPQVSQFIEHDARRTSEQIRSDSAFREAYLSKPKHLDQMSQDERDSFKKILDGRLPVDRAVAALA